MQLKDYIGEATAYDKKLMLERKDPTSWLKSVSAFANTQGGTLLFGVANDGALVGLADAQSDSEFISETIKMQMDPVPVIADLFQRLDLMERRGSGFGKIIDAYKAESDKRCIDIKPFFRSSATAFYVILPNLNYGLKTGSTTTVTTTDTTTVTTTVEDLVLTKTVPEMLGKETARVYRLISLDRRITAAKIATILRISLDGARYHLKKIKSANLARYVGNPKSDGHWEVVK